MEHPVELAKNIGAVLGTASVVGYACGYLALHARAFALGTDPAFKLVDQVYVFAGARFLIATLIAVLVLAPVMLAVRWAAIAALRLLPAVHGGADPVGRPDPGGDDDHSFHEHPEGERYPAARGRAAHVGSGRRGAGERDRSCGWG